MRRRKTFLALTTRISLFQGDYVLVGDLTVGPISCNIICYFFIARRWILKLCYKISPIFTDFIWPRSNRRSLMFRIPGILTFDWMFFRVNTHFFDESTVFGNEFWLRRAISYLPIHDWISSFTKLLLQYSCRQSNSAPSVCLRNVSYAYFCGKAFLLPHRSCSIIGRSQTVMLVLNLLTTFAAPFIISLSACISVISYLSKLQIWLKETLTNFIGICFLNANVPLIAIADFQNRRVGIEIFSLKILAMKPRTFT